MDIAKTAAFVLDEEEALNEDISRFRWKEALFLCNRFFKAVKVRWSLLMDYAEYRLLKERGKIFSDLRYYVNVAAYVGFHIPS